MGDQGEYAVLVLFGTVAVAIHAFSLYGQSTRVESGEDVRKRLLASIPIAAQGGSRFRHGFAFYLLVTEFVYLILVFSSGILVTSLSVLGRADLAGAISGDVEFNLLVPLAASSVVIAATQVKPLADVERAFRRMAHSLAGIPDTVYEIQETAIDCLECLFQEMKDTDTFRSGSDDSNIALHAYHKATRWNAGPQTIPDELDLERFRKCLFNVYCLHDWTIGSEGSRIWIGQEAEQVLEPFRVHADGRDFRKLTGRLDELDPQAPTDALRTELAETVPELRALESRLLTLLALLLLNKPEAKVKRHPALDKLVRRCNRPGKGIPMINAHLRAIVAGTLVSLIVLAFYLSAQEGIKDHVRDRLEPDKLGPIHLDNERLAGPLAALLRESGGGDGFSETTAGIVDDGVTAVAARFGDQLGKASWEVLNYLVVFAVSTTIALLGPWGRTRRRLHSTSSPAAVQASPPETLTTAGVGLLAYGLAAGILVVINFGKLAVLPVFGSAAAVFSSTNLIAFMDELPRLLLFPLVAIVCVLFVHRVERPSTRKRVAQGARESRKKLRESTAASLPAVRSRLAVPYLTLYAGYQKTVAEPLRALFTKLRAVRTKALGESAEFGSKPLVIALTAAILVLAVVLTDRFGFLELGTVSRYADAASSFVDDAGWIATLSLGALTVLALLIAVAVIGTLRRAVRIDDAFDAVRSAALFGVGIGTINLLLRAMLGTLPTAWSVANVALMPAISFTLFFLCYRIAMDRERTDWNREERNITGGDDAAHRDDQQGRAATGEVAA